ncbi:MAG TPA: sugar phosphate isomerase/epimerase family protein [Tepidisphaeraceae bacterium]|jgi:sugar phosphate isomerase/epimerase
MKIGNHDIAVCSWSLRTTDPSAMIRATRELGLSHCQLALTPLVLADETSRQTQINLLLSSGLTWTAGMISFPGEDYASIASIKRTGGFVPDADWPRRRQIAQDALAIAESLSIKKISTHIGFVPPSNDEHYPIMIQRTREIAELWNTAGVDLLLETGQEEATELLQFLNDVPCRNIGVNFDPANMILYGAGDPFEAIAILAQRIGHVHIKDAIPSENRGIEWGREVPFGTGEVKPKKFLASLAAANYTGPLSIEREGRAANPIEDIHTAITALSNAIT